MNFHFEGGVKSFVRYLNKNREIVNEPVYIDMEVETTQVEAAIQYTDSFSSRSSPLPTRSTRPTAAPISPACAPR
jgi:DNA gyrase/topoisomerase IV subunit B